MTDTTPLHRLADHWRERGGENRQIAEGASSSLQKAASFAAANSVESCADELEASLQAIDVEDLAREVADEFWYQAGVKPSELSVKKAEDKLTSRLQSAFAAGQAQGWETCPVTDRAHEFARDRLMNLVTDPEKGYRCIDCGILRSAVEKPATPDSPSAADAVN